MTTFSDETTTTSDRLAAALAAVLDDDHEEAFHSYVVWSNLASACTDLMDDQMMALADGDPDQESYWRKQRQCWIDQGRYLAATGATDPDGTIAFVRDGITYARRELHESALAILSQARGQMTIIKRRIWANVEAQRQDAIAASDEAWVKRLAGEKGTAISLVDLGRGDHQRPARPDRAHTD